MQQLLRELGFSTREVIVYTTLLKRGRMTHAEIAKQTKITRPTVYHVVHALEAKGLVSEDLAGKTRQLIAQSPERLKELLKEDRERLKQKEQTVQEAIKVLQQLPHLASIPIPKIRFIEEKKVKAFLYQEAEKWDVSAQSVDHTWWGFQDHQIAEQYREWIDWLWKEIYKETSVKLLSNPADVEKRLKKIYKKREIRVLRQPSLFSATTWVVGDYLIMLVTQTSPHYLIEIHDRILSQNMRALFKAVWETSVAFC